MDGHAGLAVTGDSVVLHDVVVDRPAKQPRSKQNAGALASNPVADDRVVLDQVVIDASGSRLQGALLVPLGRVARYRDAAVQGVVLDGVGDYAVVRGWP